MPTLKEFTELSDESRDTYERQLGQDAPSGAIVFDDEPDAPIDPTQRLEGAEEEDELHAHDDEWRHELPMRTERGRSSSEPCLRNLVLKPAKGPNSNDRSPLMKRVSRCGTDIGGAPTLALPYTLAR